MKTFEYRLYTTHKQERLLLDCLRESRHLYNEMLDMQKAHYAETGRFLSKFQLCKAFAGRGDAVPATTVQCLADRLDRALRRYLTRKNTDPKAGFPRFKSANQWHSIHLRQFQPGKDACLEEQRLRVPKKIGQFLKLKVHRPLKGTPRTGYLLLRADGHWYALIVCQTPDSAVEEATSHHTLSLSASEEAVGLDMGLKVFLADSEGHTIQNPRWYRSSEQTLRRKQRALARCRKGSRRRGKAARDVAKTHLKIARQRRDFLHKLARHYVDRYPILCVEDLNVQGMLRNHHLAKSIQDASWSAFLTLLEEKAERAARKVVRVPARFTSQLCFQCGECVPKSLSVRTHVCHHCGFVEDRDINAARNILRAGTRPSAANVDQWVERSPRSPSL